MGANIASEVVEEVKHCTSTLGCKNKKRGEILKELFETDHLKITVVADEDTVEICGALKVKNDNNFLITKNFRICRTL